MDHISVYTNRIPVLRKSWHFLRIHLARQYARLYSNDLFIGVTGTFGKTACVEASRAILSLKFRTRSTLTDLDPLVNIPNTLLKLNPQIKKVILEMGIDYIGEMDFYLSLVQPKTVILTKAAAVPAGFPGSLEEILEEKCKLIEQIPQDGTAILNWDDPNSKKIADKCKGNIIYFGTDPKNCTVWAGNIKIENYQTTFELNKGVERVKVNLQLLGHHQVFPVLAASALGVLYDIPLTKIKPALESLEPQEHRLQAVLGPNGSVVLDDTVSCSPVDLKAAIDTIIKIPARRRVLVLGEMKGLGEYTDACNRQVAQIIYKEKIDQVMLAGGDTNIIADELKSLGFWEEKLQANLQNSQMVGKLLKTLGKGDICLIKGPRAARLDEVVKRITRKQ